MPEIYSRESLAVAASFSWCLTDFLEKLEVGSTPARRGHLLYRLRKLGIDTSHWDRSPRRWYSDEMLADAVKKSVSYAGTLRLLGVPVTGGQHAHLARRIRRAGIDTSHFLGQAHFRGRSAPKRAAVEILVHAPSADGRVKTEILRRALREIGVPERCALCECDGTWQGATLRLVIDHINGDWRDNRRENLRFLCPNCHAQTSTWCRKTQARAAS